jgi:DNA-cytosine methyltransferase
MNRKKLNVLSLFDGMSCGRIALERAGVPVNHYFASEVDKYAVAVSDANWSDTYQLGDVRNVQTMDGLLYIPDADTDGRPPLYDIDLLIGGSPCQDFSFAGKQAGFNGQRGALFFEYLRLLRDLKPRYFLLENVRMKKDNEQAITDYLTSAGYAVTPVHINSNRFSAQNRHRVYWTNIPQDALPNDAGIKLGNILESGFTDRDKAHCIDANYFKGGNLRSYFLKNRRQLVAEVDSGLILAGHADLKGHDYNRRVYHPEGKSPALCANSGGNLEPKVLCGAFRGRYNPDGSTSQRLELQIDGRTNSLTTVQKDNVAVSIDDVKWRKLTPLECERLQTVPEGYTAHVSNTQRYKMLGNGWTVDVIAHLFKNLNA